MAGSFNSITLVGYVGRDPESRTTTTGNTITTFTVATNDRRKDQEEQTTTWFKVSSFGRQAEVAQRFLRKGSYVYLQGTISQETYNDRDGQQRTSLEVRARDLQMLDKRDGDGNGAPGQRSYQRGPVGDHVPF